MLTTNEIHIDSTIRAPEETDAMWSGGDKAFEIHDATFKEHGLLMTVLNRIPCEHLILVKDITFVDSEDELKTNINRQGDPCRIAKDGTVVLVHEEHNENFEETVVHEMGQVVLYQYLRYSEFDDALNLYLSIPPLDTKVYDSMISCFIRAYEDYLFNPETLKKDYPTVYDWMRTYVFHGKSYSLPNEWIKPRRLPEPLKKNDNNQVSEENEDGALF